jgi:hypothetical protein
MAHDERLADAATEKAAVRAFQRRAARVTLLVLLVAAFLVVFFIATRWLTGIVYESSGESLVAVSALRLLFGGALAELVLRVMLRARRIGPEAAPFLRWYFLWIGFQLVGSPKDRAADPLWVHAGILVVVGLGMVTTGLLRRRALGRVREKFENR